MLTLDNVYRASYALKSVIRKTDVIHAPKLNKDSNIYLKTENLQITGSFKVTVTMTLIVPPCFSAISPSG